MTEGAARMSSYRSGGIKTKNTQTGPYINRKSKLGSIAYFNPKQIINSLHAKSHFKASETIKNS